MAELTVDQVRSLDAVEIAKLFRRAAEMQREHIAITYDHGLDLVNIVAAHGDAIADAILGVSRGLDVSTCRASQT